MFIQLFWQLRHTFEANIRAIYKILPLKTCQKIFSLYWKHQIWPPTSAYVHENSFERSYTIGREGRSGHKSYNGKECTVWCSVFVLRPLPACLNFWDLAIIFSVSSVIRHIFVTNLFVCPSILIPDKLEGYHMHFNYIFAPLNT